MALVLRPAAPWLRLPILGLALMLSTSAQALTEQVADVSAGFWDGVSQPPFCRTMETDPVFAEVACTGTEVSGTSSGSTVVMARASAGSLGASAYTGWIEGTDTYYGYANARSEDDFTITGGTPNGTATVAVGAIVNGGLGIYGSDAAADARAYFRFQGAALSSGSTFVFTDRAHGEGPEDNPTHVYDYGVRNDYRFIDVMLDATGSGAFGVELRLEISAFEEGDENAYLSASAADYGDTIDSHVQAWGSDFTLTSMGGWEVRAFGTPLDVSPAPVSLTLEQLGIVPEPGAAPLLGLSLGAFALVRRPRSRP